MKLSDRDCEVLADRPGGSTKPASPSIPIPSLDHPVLWDSAQDPSRWEGDYFLLDEESTKAEKSLALLIGVAFRSWCRIGGHSSSGSRSEDRPVGW